jgi:hypothetical protein
MYWRISLCQLWPNNVAFFHPWYFLAYQAQTLRNSHTRYERIVTVSTDIVKG